MRTTNTSPSQLTRGYLLALLSALVLSGTGIFIRYLTETYRIPALVLAFWRDGFVTLTLLAVLGIFFRHLLRVRRSHLPYLLLFGFLMAIFNSFWTLSVAFNGAAVSTVLVYSSTGFTALLGYWLLKERLDWARLITVVLSLGGCVLVSGALLPEAWKVNLLGIFVGLLSGLWYALYTLMGRLAAQRGINAWTTLMYTCGFAAVFLLFFNLLPGGFLPGSAARPADFFWLQDMTGWSILFLLAAGPTLLGFGLYNVSLGYLPSAVVNLIVALEPALTAVIAYYLLGERLSPLQLFGSVMILSSVLYLRIHDGRVERREHMLAQENSALAAGK